MASDTGGRDPGRGVCAGCEYWRTEMSDLIERQAAIDAINEIRGTMNMVADIVADKYLIDAQNNIKLLPPVQPKFKAIANIQLTQEQVDKAFERAKEDILSVQPVNRWIPCSERLPVDEDYRESMECLDGCVWYFTDKGSMGLGYYYYSTKEWSTLRDLKPDGKVIAWMPLPSPYKEGE